MNEQLPRLLTTRLTETLPGPMVASRFESRPCFWRHYDPPPHGARPAAVLVLLYPHGGQWHLPLTLRPGHLADHGGQISLPGGALEPGETSRQAAIREFHEELGAEKEEFELLGQLSPLYVRASNFLVTPWVGAAAGRPRLAPNPAEVEELLEVPLPHLFEEANFATHRRYHQGRPYTAPHFVWQSHRIWGATCLILGELITVLQNEDL